MNLFLSFVAMFLGRCLVYGHETYRMRRPYLDVEGVYGYQCKHCRHWEPAVKREPAELLKAKRAGYVRKPKAKGPQRGKVLEMPRKFAR